MAEKEEVKEKVKEKLEEKKEEKTEKTEKKEKKEDKGPSSIATDYAPSLHPPKSHDPDADAEKLYKAMKGFGTDEKAIIAIAGARSNEQLQDVRRAFKKAHNKDLIKELESETSGNFRKLLVALFRSRHAYDAMIIRDSVKGAGTDEHALIDVLAHRSNEQIAAMKESYTKDFSRDLIVDVLDDTSFNFKGTLRALMAGARDESWTVDEGQATADCTALFEAGENRWGTDDDKFIELFTKRSYPSLRRTFAIYKEKHGKEIVDVIKSETSGDYCSCLCAIAKVIQDPIGYYSHRFEKAMKGLGTDDEGLIRLVVCRCEIDLEAIKKRFLEDHKKTLKEWISDDTSGDYKHLLLAVVGSG